MLFLLGFLIKNVKLYYYIYKTILNYMIQSSIKFLMSFLLKKSIFC